MMSTTTTLPPTHLSLEGSEIPSTDVTTPKILPNSFLSSVPKLTYAQAGHIRHFHNIAGLLPGEWRHMGTQEPAQEFLDAYRYQLAIMAYAAGAAHYHRLPALRSVFKTLLKMLIDKMLRKEVWGYWYLTSQSGKLVNPSIKELRKPWADPNKKENIMYSGHLLLMVSLYSMLFNDDTYDAPDALVFKWDPIFWGMGPETFKYSRSSLQQAILDEMERENWLGVCCEPNNIFVACNQFPIIAMRYNDIRSGTDVVSGVLERYKSSWEKVGIVADSGLFVDMYLVEQRARISQGHIGFSAWASAFMNSWNTKQVHSVYESQALGFLQRVSPDRVNLNPPPIANAIRSLIASDPDMDPQGPETLAQARAVAAPPKQSRSGYKLPTFGYVIQWVSEVGDNATLDGLLNHADQYMNPQWELGGLFYPRCDTSSDNDGNWTHVDPFTGNAGIGYARLNVPDGQHKMWEQPWTKGELDERPFVDDVVLSGDVDFLRGSWVDEIRAMVLTMRTWHGNRVSIRPVIRNLKAGRYAIYVNNEWSEEKVIGKTDDINIAVDVDGHETDVVILQI